MHQGDQNMHMHTHSQHPSVFADKPDPAASPQGIWAGLMLKVSAPPTNILFTRTPWQDHGVFARNNGFITLLSMLVASAIGIAIAIPLLLSALDGTRASLVRQQGVQARALADACAEVALEKLGDSKSYAGEETLTLSTGTCTILPVLGSGNKERTVQTIGAAGDAVRKLWIDISDLKPSVTVSSWREVGDF